MDDEYTSSPISRRGSTFAASPNGEEEDDEHVQNFVASELQRVRSTTSIAAYEDELETKAEQNGNGNGQNGHP